MAAIDRQVRSPSRPSALMPVVGLAMLGVLAVAVLLLAVFEDLTSYRGGNVVLVSTTVGAGCAISALLVVAIRNVRLMRAAEIEGARINAMMTAMDAGVCCVDEGGRLTYMNAAAQRMLVRTFNDHAGEDLSTVFSLTHRQGEANQDSPLFSGVLAGEFYAGRDSVLCGDGSVLFVDVRVAPILLPGERAGAVIVFGDDTDRSREEQAKDDFVGFAAHELRSPLTAMHGFSSWLAGKLEREPWRFDAQTAAAIALLASETGRMESIIELFLDLTQIRMNRLSLQPELVDVTMLLREECSALRSRYPAATFEELLPAERLLAVLDEQRVRQVVLNLLDNAAKYGGAAPRIVISLTVSDTVAELRVKDSGSGIPGEDQQHIFERFFRSTAPATETKKGFGIGMYVSKQIVDRMGGELSFVSKEGRGTEFTLRLPIVLEELVDDTCAPVVATDREVQPVLVRA